MSAVVFAVLWSLSGVVGALTDRYERSSAWVAAGVLLGPLWLAIRADRPVADRLAPTLAQVHPSRLR